LFSGELNPRFELTEAMADLNCWLGNADEAIALYSSLVKQQPANAGLRNKLVELLEFNKRYPAVVEQLDSLYLHQQLRNAQFLQLANFKLKANQLRQASELLEQYLPANTLEKKEHDILQIKLDILSGNPKKALDNTLNLGQNIITDNDWDETLATKIRQNNFALYSNARLYAILKKDEQAFSYLKKALDSGMRFQYLLTYDKAFDRMRTTKRWAHLLGNYSFEDINQQYESGNSNTGTMNYNTVSYRIPGSYFGPDRY
jgi:tetratricopeptide (TPR) repeat protein